MIRTHHYAVAAAAVTAVLLSTAPAHAQQQTNWTGAYVGANLGASWGDNATNITAIPGTGAVVIPPGDVDFIHKFANNLSNKTGFAGGGEVGYNYQNGPLVLGIETDFGAFDIDQNNATTFTSTVSPASVSISHRVGTDWLWTVRPRIGYAGSNWMVYGTAGMAMSDVKVNTSYADTRVPPNVANIEVDENKTGWVAGVGAAYAFNQHWSAKLEWLYTDLGSVHGRAPTANAFATIDSETQVRANVIRLGVDYKF
jgi:outer membrane immunogenic protein